MAQTLNQQIAAAKRTKKFAALITVGVDETTALKTLGINVPVVDPLAAQVAALVEAGFTEAEAREVLAAGAEAEPEPTKGKAKTAAEVEVDPAEALVAQHGYGFTKGRVYGGVTLAEAIVRVHKTGTPEIVTSSGVGRTAALLVSKQESGDVSVQNLRKPA